MGLGQPSKLSLACNGYAGNKAKKLQQSLIFFVTVSLLPQRSRVDHFQGNVWLQLLSVGNLQYSADIPVMEGITPVQVSVP